MTGGSYREVFQEDRSGLERERLDALAATYDQGTFACLDAIGVSSAWRCLEVGAGTGTVARWLARRVAPAVVVASDRDTRFLGGSADPHLVIQHWDLTTDTLPEKAFDLVFARFVLMHMTERHTVLRRLHRAVAPGGYLVIADGDTTLGLASGFPEMATLWKALAQILAVTVGTEVTWTRSLPRRFQELGLTDIAVRAETPTLAGGGDHARFCELTLDTVEKVLLETGALDERAIADIRARLRDPMFQDLGPSVVYTWARRPR
jgi:SAM-dependent methyltransferase